ncbi:LbtU family siderophore porin [Kaarinaea lacus]
MFFRAKQLGRIFRFVQSFSLIFLLLVISNFALASTTEISGVVEAEFGTGDDFDGNSSSDIVTATVEIAIDAEISEWFSGHVVLLHEEDDTPLEVDQGFITFGNTFLSSFSMSFGQQYVPFGSFESNLVSDPLTLEIGETRESAIIFAYDGDLYASFYMFNGDMNETGGDSSVDSMGFNLGYAYEGESMNFDVGVSYISNLKDSDGLSGSIIEYRDAINEAVPDSFPAPEEVDEYTAGFGGHMIWEWGSFTFIGEFIAAMDNFAVDELANTQRKPSATNLEFAYGITDNFGVALGFQNSVDMGGYLPESRLLLGLSYALDEKTGLAFEYASDSDYGTADGGTGDSASTITIQLATEF